MKKAQITILSTPSTDKIMDKNYSTLSIQKGGPVLYIKRCFDRLKFTAIVNQALNIDVEILVNEKGEFGKIKNPPATKTTDYSKIDTPYLSISTILNEWELKGISSYKGKVFLDVQGYVRDGDFFRRKKKWDPEEEISNSIFCMKGTSEEISNLSPDFLKIQKNKILIITKGQKGVELWVNNKKKEIEPNTIIKTKNTIGAGDTFFANLIYSYANTEDIYKSVTFAIKETETFLDKELKQSIKEILFLSAVHGDEGFSVPILKKLERELPQKFSWVIANEKALEAKKRFIDIDLNRAAPGNKEAKQYEAKKAYELIETAKNFRYIVDIHGTISASGIFTIITNPTQRNLRLASLLPPKNIVIWEDKNKSKNGPVTRFVDCGAEIECGPKYSKKIQIQLFNTLRNIAKKGIDFDSKPIRNKKFFQVYGKLLKSKYTSPKN